MRLARQALAVTAFITQQSRQHRQFSASVERWVSGSRLWWGFLGGLTQENNANPPLLHTGHTRTLLVLACFSNLNLAGCSAATRLGLHSLYLAKRHHCIHCTNCIAAPSAVGLPGPFAAGQSTASRAPQVHDLTLIRPSEPICHR